MAEWWEGLRADRPLFPYRGIRPVCLAGSDELRARLTCEGDAYHRKSLTYIESSRNCDLIEVATEGRKEG